VIARPAPVIKPFDSRSSAGPSRPRKAPPTVFDTNDALLVHDLGFDDSKLMREPERAPVAMLPLAMMLILGLLLGFGAGYVVGDRAQAPADDSVTAASATGEEARPSSEPAPAGTTSPPARDSTEEPVTPSRPANAPTAPGDAASAAPPSASGSTGARPTPAPAPRRGRLVVRSTPSGAGVTVNGDWRGRTPLPLEDLGFGKYTVRVVQPGYQVAREVVTLSAAQPERTLSLRLNRQAAAPPATRSAPAAKPAAPRTFTGSVFVDSRPRGALVLLDGKEYGRTPLSIPDVPVGSHIIRLELADHRFWTNSIRVTAGQSTPVTGSLEPIR
jgi:hypothetical protein